MAPLMSLKGLNFSNSDIELYDDRLTIKHFLLPLHEIPVKGIVKIEDFSKPGLLGPGIMLVRGKDAKGQFKTLEIYYNHGGAADIEKLRTTLERMRNGTAPGTGQSAAVAPPAKPVAPVAPLPPTPPASSNMGEIEKLAELKAKGIITEDEFEAKKHQLLFGDKSGPVIHEKEIIREIVKVPCAYCGVLMEITNSKCPSCGAPINRR
jgi:hypothetical protein